MSINVLHITNTDIAGCAFNGYDLINDLAPFNISGRQMVLDKISSNPAVIELLGRHGRAMRDALRKLEQEVGANNLFFPWAKQIVETPAFQNADVIHYHLWHNQVISLFDFAWITHQKPCVWTIHDPWFFTGHCIQPQQCIGWKNGCIKCPHLDYAFSLQKDTAHIHWTIKYANSLKIAAQPIVASSWMKDLTQKSPIGQNLKTPILIPFGIDTASVLSSNKPSASKTTYHILPTKKVIFFRSDNIAVKGVDYIIEALDLLPDKVQQSVALLTVGDRKLPQRFYKKFQIVQLPWTNSRTELFELYNACDLFLMPSLAEAFGLMAIEAMAVGRPVIVFSDTALPDIIDAPHCGIEVPFGDSSALATAIHQILENDALRLERGRLGQELVRKRYQKGNYLAALAQTYQAVIDNG